MDFIARATVAGVDPRSFLNAESEEEMEFLRVVAEKAIKSQELQQKNLAIMIINNLSQSMGSK